MKVDNFNFTLFILFILDVKDWTYKLKLKQTTKYYYNTRYTFNTFNNYADVKNKTKRKIDTTNTSQR